MKITGTRTQLVELPADEPLAGAAENPSGKRPIVTLRVETDEGVEGIGVSYFGGALTRTLAHAIDELGALCVGEDPVRVEAVTQKLRNAAGGSGPGGIFNLALSALDTALWDIRAKSMNLPLWKLLGGAAKEKLEAYNTDIGWLSIAKHDLVAKCKRAIEHDGFRRLKLKVGHDDPMVDVDRIEDRLTREECQTNFRIGGKRQRGVIFGRGVTNLMTHQVKLAPQHFEGAHDAVDLRGPGIGDDQNLQGLSAW